MNDEKPDAIETLVRLIDHLVLLGFNRDDIMKMHLDDAIDLFILNQQMDSQ